MRKPVGSLSHSTRKGRGRQSAIEAASADRVRCRPHFGPGSQNFGSFRGAERALTNNFGTTWPAPSCIPASFWGVNRRKHHGNYEEGLDERLKRTFSRHAERHIFCREEDSCDFAENGESGAKPRFEG